MGESVEIRSALFVLLLLLLLFAEDWRLGWDNALLRVLVVNLVVVVVLVVVGVVVVSVGMTLIGFQQFENSVRRDRKKLFPCYRFRQHLGFQPPAIVPDSRTKTGINVHVHLSEQRLA